MYRGACRLRIFALVWAVLQVALPAFATLADAQRVVGSAGRAHVEGPGRDCAPSHSSDCVVCKHLSTLSLGSTHAAMSPASNGGDGVTGGRIAPAPRTLAGAALPRAPPAHL